jgi:glutamate synthase (ferredoxin)
MTHRPAPARSHPTRAPSPSASASPATDARRTPPTPYLPTPHAPLYDRARDHDACGVGFIAHLRDQRSHDVVSHGLTALEKLAHRAATGAESDTGDGAGVMIQIPDALYRAELQKQGVFLPPPGRYAVGLFFGSPDTQACALAKMLFAMIARQEGLQLLGWRAVPTDDRQIGATARAVEPAMLHVFLAPSSDAMDQDAFERKLYVVRKRYQSTIWQSGIDDRQYFHVPSLSSRTTVYKGMLTPEQVRRYFADLRDPRCESALCMFHSRFSTNTFPSWELAHPYSMLAHNGEINTLRGNINWMRAREAMLSSPLFGDDVEKLLPIAREGLSDSAVLDSVLELLVRGGRSLPHAMMMLIPEAWEGNPQMPREKRDFYAYHACMMEPWDGPAAVMFTDGRSIGAVLDRNGLRPSRYWITKDDLVIVGSEVGVLDVPPERIARKGRLEPGKMFLVSLDEGRIVDDAEIKAQLARERPYGQWLSDHLVELHELPAGDVPPRLTGDALRRAQIQFGYTLEDLHHVLGPMADKGQEELGSMGNDTALAVLSERPQSLYNYFKQLFAQVTNPPLDAIREELVTSVKTVIGPEGNLLASEPEACHLVLCDSPFLTNEEMARLETLDVKDLPVRKLDMLFPVAEGAAGLEPALQALFAKADRAIAEGARVIVLSDRGANAEQAPIPALLAVSGLHNHLVREKRRTRVALLVQTGDAREVHHFACLLGFGASAVNPWLALDGVAEHVRAQGDPAKEPDPKEIASAQKRYLAAVKKGVVKVMSKMGISTINSYRGAQQFEALGLSRDLVDRYFTHTASRIGGVGAIELASDVLAHHHHAYDPRHAGKALELDWGGLYHWRRGDARRGGELHLFNPETVFKLQHATRTGKYKIFKEFTAAADAVARRTTLRGLLELRTAGRTPVPLDEVEPVEAITRRFATGAMSYGSISAEAHETLALAMNAIGGKSNSGEGGEDPARYAPLPDGRSKRSAIHQVASGRFGVTSEYLVHCDEIQIKMAQGAKPGEGGQLPGNKVVPWIARVRFATAGVGLISPPPHHDIYSIEDLAQLIYDLRCANPRARISVKLVSEVGVGTVAAGVAKAKSDLVLISGHDGGTGASPLTSLRHAGIPWELGLAEAQQTLVANRLRDRITVQVDGQMKTGRDVIVAALLGAEEYGFATSALVVMGCVMMRVCHLDTCPVGIATQNPELRQKFSGRAEHVIAFFRFVAEEVREYLSQLGFRTLDEAIGRSDLLEVTRALPVAKARGLDLSALLARPVAAGADGAPVATRKVRAQDPGTADHLDHELIREAGPALERGERVSLAYPIRNVDRTIGTMLGSELTRRHGAKGLPDDTIEIRFHGSAGQSFGAFLPRGITLHLEGDANDYVGKGLSGGRLSVRPPREATFKAEENIVIGNVALYGATSGEAFFRGRGGERFCVRNSGAHAVIEGVGDHGCEYMTGGRVVVLGPVGRNFAAGMSGGIAYLLSEATGPAAVQALAPRINAELVRAGNVEDAEEIALLRALVAKHFSLTESPVAGRLLQDWDAAVARFVRIMPLDYERALEREHRERVESARLAAAE